VVVFFTLIATLIGVVSMKNKRTDGRGGNAITAGDGAAIDLHNQGIVRAGKGGKGGSGGDAVYVDPGVKITIINHGVIAGGDAGSNKDGGA
jgi:hypothetical protein